MPSPSGRRPRRLVVFLSTAALFGAAGAPGVAAADPDGPGGQGDPAALTQSADDTGPDDGGSSSQLGGHAVDDDAGRS